MYLSASSFVPGRVDIQQVGDAQQTVVTPAQVATHRRHRVQRTGRADRISTHQRRVRTVLMAAATAVQRGPLHFGDEQRLHERAGPVVQTVQRSELGLVTAENVATPAAATATGCGTAFAPAAVATIVASMAVIVVVAAADYRRAAASVVAASGRHCSATVAATPVQVAKGRGRTPTQVAGHPSAFLRLARRRRHRTISLLLLLFLLLLWVVLTLTASSSLSSSSSLLPLTGHTG